MSTQTYRLQTGACAAQLALPSSAIHLRAWDRFRSYNIETPRTQIPDPLGNSLSLCLPRFSPLKKASKEKTNKQASKKTTLSRRGSPTCVWEFLEHRSTCFLMFAGPLPPSCASMLGGHWTSRPGHI